MLGCLVGFAGAVVIGFATSTRGFQAGVGAVLCIAAAAVYSGGVTAEKRLLRRNSPLTVTWLACAIGAVVCLPFAPQLAHDLSRSDPGTIAWAIYLGLFPTAVGFSFWAYALALTSGGRMGAIGISRPAGGDRDGMGGAGRRTAGARAPRGRSMPWGRRDHARGGHPAPSGDQSPAQRLIGYVMYS